MKVSLSLLLLGVATNLMYGVTASDTIDRFHNFKSYNVFFENADQMKELIKLNEKYSVNLFKYGDFNGAPFYLAIDPAKQADFENDLKERNISFELINDNLQDLLDRRYNPNQINRASNNQMEWTQYHDLKTINCWMSRIVRENSFIRKRIIGFSAESRPIHALIVSKKRNNKAIYIQSNIHAIEWISSAVSTYFLNYLITTKSDLLDKYDWIFVPVLNTDGFEYTHTTNPIWRKNRRYAGFRNSSGLCYGVDLNRNYPEAWGTSGYNLKDPCDHFFAGPSAESEPELKAEINFVRSFTKGYIRMFLAIHSYGQLVLHPYGYTEEKTPPNIDDLTAISQSFTQGVKASSGTTYTAGTSGKLLSPVSGDSKDYYYEQGIKYTATIELRDRGQYGFFLPPEFIVPTGNEVIAGLSAMVKTAQERGIFN